MAHTVSADGLAPLGARTSAGTVMVHFGLRAYMEPAIKGLIRVLCEQPKVNISANKQTKGVMLEYVGYCAL